MKPLILGLGLSAWPCRYLPGYADTLASITKTCTAVATTGPYVQGCLDRILRVSLSNECGQAATEI
jgi:hypothetical protein